MFLTEPTELPFIYIPLFWTQYLIVDSPLLHLALFLWIYLFLLIGDCFLSCHYLWDASCLLLLIKLICFDFLSLWLNFYGRRPVRFSGAVSLISWMWCSWEAYVVYIGFLDVIGVWLLLGLSLVGPSLKLVDCGSLHPRCLVCYCVGGARTKPQSPWNKSTTIKITPPCNPTNQQQMNQY